MIIIPTLELQNGRPVSLGRGRIDEAMIWHVDPVVRARDWVQAGASWLHLTDLDAVAGTEDNRELICRIINEAGVPVQVAGGIRSRERAEEWFERGAGRVVIGTAGVVNPAMVRELAKYHPDAVVLAVDVWDGKVVLRGWKETSSFDPEDFIAHFDEAPLAAILVTDIAADVGETDARLALVTRLAGATRHPVIASGMVRDIDDVARLKYVRNVAGALAGRALFLRSLDLAEALALAARRAEPVADFL